ncbi:MAG: nuclear transport factor 2 family protein [Defluviitaleaceae bacterium]|nr:nuclear transport factor 2 family protein [Defluviitaleaceae bacterium]
MKEIIDILNKLQKGYDEKKPENATVLVNEIFSKRHNLLALGTGTYEICLDKDAVTEIMRSDWDGGWGDFKMDIENAEIETDGDVAWFLANATVRYTFENKQENYDSYVGFIKQHAENQNTTPKQRIAFINWILSLRFHNRADGLREYFWPTKLSGFLAKEDGVWKLDNLHFSIDKSNFPDERFENTTEDYKGLYNKTREKIKAYNGEVKTDTKLIEALKELEIELKNDKELGGINFDKEQIVVSNAERFTWIMAMATIKQTISEDEIMNKSLKELDEVLNSNLSSQEKVFLSQKSVSYALSEIASGTEFTWPIRLTAVLEKGENSYKFRHKHFSYPFDWIIEGKL